MESRDNLVHPEGETTNPAELPTCPKCTMVMKMVKNILTCPECDKKEKGFFGNTFSGLFEAIYDITVGSVKGLKTVKEEFVPTVKRTFSELISVKDVVIQAGQTDEDGNNIITELKIESIYLPIARRFGIVDKNNPMYPASEEDIKKLEEIKLKEEDKEEDPETGEMNPPQCRICMTEIEEGAIKTPCGHYFDKDCIMPWLRIHNRCPICKSVVAK
ncbi:unnamed protein product [Moneuplotes crassus]|uniref:RING-type domain-containing protein n=1 Tax=Euplotes crassus TaxID=5936 RepID=A0AAD2D4T2_EUPCR|nr:unnamed protein product [Moneuplotes crassus]